MENYQDTKQHLIDIIHEYSTNNKLFKEVEKRIRGGGLKSDIEAIKLIFSVVYAIAQKNADKKTSNALEVLDVSFDTVCLISEIDIAKIESDIHMAGAKNK
ncbi:hypothetical protein ACFLU5_14845 [Bacteroidota bacterium]